MARRARVDRRLAAAAVAVAVFAAHLAAMDWVAAELAAQPLLQPMRAPMFTRVLQQQEAPPQPVAHHPAAKRRAPRAHAMTAPREGDAALARRESIERARAEAEARAEAQRTADEAREAAQAAAQAASAAAQAAAAAASAAQASATAAAQAAASAAAAIASWPSDTRLSYRLGGRFRSGALYGNARVQWLREGERYETRIDIDVTPFTSLTLTSQGDVKPEGLAPRAYEELRRSGARRNRMTPDAVVLQDGRMVPRPPNVQDTASQFVELGHRFASGQETLEVGRAVDVWLARPGGVDRWTYDVVEREMLESPALGRIDAFHLKPRAIANPRGNITAEMWFAPALQYLPVRIRVTMGDEAMVDLMVERIEQR